MNPATERELSVRPAPLPLSAPVRLMLVSDCEEPMIWLKDLLSAGHSEINCVKTGEPLERACREECDLAVIDVGYESLITVLKMIRGAERLKDISVLVRAERIPLEANLKGVFPKYRAMPCYHEDLVRLVRQRVSGNHALTLDHQSKATSVSFAAFRQPRKLL